MTDERPIADDDDLPPPYRPWARSGVPQPGADAPASRSVPGPGQVRGRVPPPPVLPAQPVQQPAARWYPPVHPTPPPPRPPATILPPHARPDTGAALSRDRYIVGIAILSVVTAWLPWIKSPTSSMFELTGRVGIFNTVGNAWDLPAKYLWSSGRGFVSLGGVELGWLIVGLPVLMVIACMRNWSGSAVRGLAGAQTAVAILFVAQTYRFMNESTGSVRVATSYGTTDVLGLGVYIYLALSLALLIAPRR